MIIRAFCFICHSRCAPTSTSSLLRTLPARISTESSGPPHINSRPRAIVKHMKRDLLWVSAGTIFHFWCPVPVQRSKSGLMNKHTGTGIVKHIVPTTGTGRQRARPEKQRPSSALDISLKHGLFSLFLIKNCRPYRQARPPALIPLAAESSHASRSTPTSIAKLTPIPPSITGNHQRQAVSKQVPPHHP